jgi:pimeloyl-ACP methyl ester carboxylesterase
MYEELLVQMSADRFVMAPDTPGYGASDPPPEPPSIATYAQSMLAVMDAYGIDAVDVLGYHTGSKTAVELARSSPRRIRSLFLVSAPHYTEEELAAQSAALATPRPARADGSHLVAQFTELVRWRPPGTPLELVQREFAEQQRAGERAHWGYLAAFAYQHRDHLPHVRQSVLLLCPADDLEVPTLRAAALVRRGRFLHRPDWGHQVMITHTAEVAEMVREHTGAAGR